MKEEPDRATARAGLALRGYLLLPKLHEGHGAPRAHGAEAAVAGLRFIGYVQRPGKLGYMAKEAKRAARAIARELRLAAAIRGAAPLSGGAAAKRR